MVILSFDARKDSIIHCQEVNTALEEAADELSGLHASIQTLDSGSQYIVVETDPYEERDSGPATEDELERVQDALCEYLGKKGLMN